MNIACVLKSDHFLVQNGSMSPRLVFDKPRTVISKRMRIEEIEMGKRCAVWMVLIVTMMIVIVALAMIAVRFRPYRVTLLGQALLRHRIDQDMEMFRILFSDSDVIFTDIETAVNGTMFPSFPTRDYLLHSAPVGILDDLLQIGINLFTQCNNHAYDMGTNGILNGIYEMNLRQMVFSGTGENIDKASEAGILHTRFGRVGLISFASGAVNESGIATEDRAGVNILRGEEIKRKVVQSISWDAADKFRIMNEIATTKRENGIVVVYHHNHYWTEDWVNQTGKWTQEIAHDCIDSGADIYVSHGAPVLHGIEIYKGKVIFYNLGNFIFHSTADPEAYPDEVWESVLANLIFSPFTNTLHSIELIPIILESSVSNMHNRGTPLLANQSTSLKILSRLQTISSPYNTTIKTIHSKGRIDL